LIPSHRDFMSLFKSPELLVEKLQNRGAIGAGLTGA
jgi:hypothetical protein